MNKEEPQRLSSILFQKACTGENTDNRVYSTALEVGVGTPPPVEEPSPDFRLSSCAFTQASSGFRPPQACSVGLEVAYQSASKRVDCSFVALETADGEIVPRDMTPYFRASTIVSTQCLSGSNVPCLANTVALEIATQPNIYSPYSSIQISY